MITSAYFFVWGRKTKIEEKQNEKPWKEKFNMTINNNIPLGKYFTTCFLLKECQKYILTETERLILDPYNNGKKMELIKGSCIYSI